MTNEPPQIQRWSAWAIALTISLTLSEKVPGKSKLPNPMAFIEIIDYLDNLLNKKAVRFSNSLRLVYSAFIEVSLLGFGNFSGRFSPTCLPRSLRLLETNNPSQ